jgi:hypothetical protein
MESALAVYGNGIAVSVLFANRSPQLGLITIHVFTKRFGGAGYLAIWCDDRTWSEPPPEEVQLAVRCNYATRGEVSGQVTHQAEVVAHLAPKVIGLVDLYLSPSGEDAIPPTTDLCVLEAHLVPDRITAVTDQQIPYLVHDTRAQVRDQHQDKLMGHRKRA